MRPANGISLLRRGKGRLQASRFSQTIHIVRAFLQAFLRQMQQVRPLMRPICQQCMHCLGYLVSDYIALRYTRSRTP